MKKLMVLTLTMILIFSCDPVSDMEANIENLTSENLTIEFISFDVSSSIILQIAPNEIQLFQESFDIGSTFLEPSLVEYDSVVIKNQLDEVLKVYKPNDTNRNIYNIDSYWIASEPSKRFFKYEFEINDQDIE
ncbi:hypothetical protein [Maribacter sp. 1_MG-2023]|uniref:hypothetical protein n=1 Tax=Maribacter sp. 1_MG-2023 TaxID=3062677 RepID=UPI0026E3C434|nr:hypothetical protein [Maribacter sp. 1_MG-2023]MDO6471755.1 hypothetical protein [Maribacter sp. 1_MG-2023]